MLFFVSYSPFKAQTKVYFTESFIKKTFFQSQYLVVVLTETVHSEVKLRGGLKLRRTVNPYAQKVPDGTTQW